MACSLQGVVPIGVQQATGLGMQGAIQGTRLHPDIGVSWREPVPARFLPEWAPEWNVGRRETLTGTNSDSI